MLSKIIASLFFIVPIFAAFIVARMSLDYKGPLVALYVVGALLITSLCLWPLINIFRRQVTSWSGHNMAFCCYRFMFSGINSHSVAI